MVTAVVGEVAQYRVPFETFFPETEAISTRVPDTLLRDMYPPQAQWESVFTTLSQVADHCTKPGDHGDMVDALALLFTALVPFSFENSTRYLPRTYQQTIYRNFLSALEPLDDTMARWYVGWQRDLGIEEWDSFSVTLSANLVAFVATINAGTILYKGTARQLNELHRLSTSERYLVANLVDDFLYGYDWVQEMLATV